MLKTTQLASGETYIGNMRSRGCLWKGVAWLHPVNIYGAPRVCQAAHPYCRYNSKQGRWGPSPCRACSLMGWLNVPPTRCVCVGGKLAWVLIRNEVPTVLILPPGYRISSPAAMLDHMQCHGATVDPRNPNLGGEELGHQYVS